MYGETLDFQCQHLQQYYGRVLMANLLQKLIFDAFYVTITDTDNGSPKFFHTLFDNCLDHMLVKFEQNCMVGNIQNFEVFGAILEDVLVTYTIARC